MLSGESHMKRKSKTKQKKSTASKQSTPALLPDEGITRVTVSGYKSLLNSQSIQIKPITVLAGANSSGKSSILQPLLLLKQTLDASYDPGALLLDGPNIRFTSASQFLSKRNVVDSVDRFNLSIQMGAKTSLGITFLKKSDQPISIENVSYRLNTQEFTLSPDMSDEEIRKEIPLEHRSFIEAMERVRRTPVKAFVKRNRCFLEVAFQVPEESGEGIFMLGSSGSGIDKHIRRIIHLPGLRGNPERTYPVTAIGSAFPGTFERYAASVLAQWQEGNGNNLEELNRDLIDLGLTWKILAKRVNETQVALEVGRMRAETERGGHDLVSIADVGFGMSQVLPVIIALHAAQPTQLVFLEQPEIHLHPRAQHAMAKVIARAAKRGVRVVLETHSALLILGLQTLVANKELPSDLVALHWFRRGEAGHSEITSADLDDAGAFGEWPEDFADVSLEAESKFLDAAEIHQENS